MPETEQHLVKKLGEIDARINGWRERESKRLDQLQTQIDAVDMKASAGYQPHAVNSFNLHKTIAENEDVSRLMRDRKGSVVLTFKGNQIDQLMGHKTTIISGGTGFGDAAGGVIPIERMPTIVTEARRKLTIRDLLTARPTQSPLIYYVKVSTPLAVGQTVVEGSTKPENAVQFSTATTQVQTIATWIPASRQILDDVTELEGFLRSSLSYYVNRAEETQILSGDGTGVNLNGLITQASAFNPALLNAAAGWTRIDQIGAAIEQVDLIDEIPSTFCVLNPRDWWNLRRTKDGFGRYILGDPQMAGNPTIWDLNVVSTNSIASGTFLVGTGNAAACELRDRMEMQVEISTENQDYFTRNLVAIRAEKRMALVVPRPQAFVTGTFTTSPAGM